MYELLPPSYHSHCYTALPQRSIDVLFRFFQIEDALRSLPGAKATAREIGAAIAANPLHACVLNWAKDPQLKDAPRWHASLSYHLGHKPQVGHVVHN